MEQDKAQSLRRRLARQIVLSLWQSLIVYLIYSAYVVVWLRFTPEQIGLWLAGGVPFNLATGWIIVRGVLWMDKRLK